MEILIYLLKSTLILSLFILVFELFLKKETFYQANRIFLLTGIFLAVILPYLSVEQITVINEYIQPISTEGTSENAIFTENKTSKQPGFWQSISLINLIFILYSSVVIFFLIRFSIRLIRLKIFFRKEKNSSFKNGIRYIKTTENTNPFSFFNTIVFNPDLHTKTELELILKHEEAHVKNRHSIDMIFSNLLVFFNWFNPFCWLYRKRITENLEFLADQETTQKLNCSKAYQKSLLNYIKIEHSAFPVNNFRKSFISRRIQKLQQIKSKKYAGLKFTFILPLLTVFFFVFQVNSRAEINYIELPAEENISVKMKPVEKDTISTTKKSTKVVFVKTSEEKSFKEMQRFLKSQKIDFTYSDLKYDENGFLTQLNMSFIDKNKEKYDYSIFGDKPIPNIQLVISEDFTGFRTFTDSENKISIDKKSVVINNGRPNADIEKKLREIFKRNKSISEEENIEVNSLIESIEIFKNEEEEPYILINGKEQEKTADVKNSSSKEKNNSTLFHIDKNTPDEVIKELKKFFSANSIDFSSRSIKRNKKGEIIKLKIKTKEKSGKAYTVFFENEEGISPFKVGIKNDQFYTE